MLKKGMRVKYIGNGHFREPQYHPPIGTFGTITDIDGGSVQVNWDRETSGDRTWWCDEKDVEVVKTEFTKSDLKNGDVVKHNNGEIGIVIVDVDTIIYKNGATGLCNYRNNLTCIVSSIFDIVAVKRPSSALSCQFGAFDNAVGTLIYERKEEPEEMTLAEVCKLLGKEIKIIK